MVTANKHILVVDDDTRLRGLLQRFLREHGYFVSTAKDADEAREVMRHYRFNLLIVDVMMPKENGFEFLAKLRQESLLPVIMLTAMGGVEDRIAGLERGADDYIAKPFDTKELLLRVGNLLKRVGETKEQKQSLSLGLCVFDMQTKELQTKQGGVMHLTAVEQNLLAIMGRKSGQVFSREKLSELLGVGQSPRSIDVQITRLRKKIERDSKNPRYLQTVRGKGYMLLAD
ncbi:MAG: response regulator transcription factor [Alphaproteobacteria bacterium]|nr:response regulator transcription factor [Alphaproteobacteria bacterium]